MGSPERSGEARAAGRRGGGIASAGDCGDLPVIEQRLVFGEVAGTYDRVRPGYPTALLDEVLDKAGLPVGGRVLEVGAGTGKATVPLAEARLEVLCLEPSEEMATVARANTERFPNVTVEVSSFEDWPVDPAGFELVVSAQAWHWVTSGVRTTKAAEALAADGLLAVFWNTPRLDDSALRRRIDRAYERWAPHMVARAPGSGRSMALGEAAGELEDSPEFGTVETSEHPWRRTLATGDYLALMSTQSDHRMLEVGGLEQLLAAIGAAIDEAGGTIDQPYVARLVTATRTTPALSGSRPTVG